MYNTEIRRGDIWFAELPVWDGTNSVQGGYRPVLVVQNDQGNKFSPTTLIAPLTSKPKKSLPTHVFLSAAINGLERDSIILFEKIQDINKSSLKKYVTHIDETMYEQIDNAMCVSLGIRIDDRIDYRVKELAKELALSWFNNMLQSVDADKSYETNMTMITGMGTLNLAPAC